MTLDGGLTRLPLPLPTWQHLALLHLPCSQIPPRIDTQSQHFSTGANKVPFNGKTQSATVVGLKKEYGN
jgi:hypothetical protein